MKKILIVVLMLVFALSTAFIGIGCKQQAAETTTAAEETTAEITAAAEETTAESGEKIKITFLSHTYEPWNNKLQEQTNTFMELNPNIEVEYTYIEHKELYAKLVTAFEAGTSADVIGVYGPWMPQFISGGFLAEAPEDVIEDITTNTGKFENDAVTFSGKIYGYIQHIGIQIPIVNEDFFKGLGETLPDTWSGLAMLQDKYNDRKDIRMVALAPDSPAIVIHWSSVLKSLGGRVLNDDLKKAAFNSPEGIEATKLYMKMSTPDFPTYDANSIFLLGKTGFAIDGPWAKTFYQESEYLKDKNYHSSIPPKEKERWVSAYVWDWVVSSQATPEKQRASWDFIKFLSNDENYLDLATTIGFAPFRNANKKSMAEDPWAKGFVEALDYAFIYYDRINNWEEVEKLIGRELERAVAGEITAEEALSNAEAAVNAILE